MAHRHVNSAGNFFLPGKGSCRCQWYVVSGRHHPGADDDTIRPRPRIQSDVIAKWYCCHVLDDALLVNCYALTPRQPSCIKASVGVQVYLQEHVIRGNLCRWLVWHTMDVSCRVRVGLQYSCAYNIDFVQGCYRANSEDTQWSLCTPAFRIFRVRVPTRMSQQLCV